ncbi:MAG: polysaccharide biosynthesis C-terminal domain-containing protein [Oscillospiraceae bacterium]|nr:polysaccharide biosynthesis C-terminal domain-containing protein [Oscillospiraceae bacterium]
MKRQSFIKGSLLLIGSAALAKVIGAIFRIPLANMLGGTGMGYFSAAYGIFMTVYAVSVSGIPAAAARFTAEFSASAPQKLPQFRKTALAVCFGAGLFFTIITLLLAYPFCVFVSRSPLSAPAAAMIAPSVFFCCVTAVYRGFYEGQRNMFPTAVSQVIEAVIKLGAGLFLCRTVMNLSSEKLADITDIICKLFPLYYINSSSAEELRLPLAAAAAISGVTISTAAGMFFVTAYNSNVNKLFIKSKLYPSMSTELARSFTAAVIPVAAGALMTNLTSLIDLMTITRSLEKAIEISPESFSGIPSDEIPAFFYGSFTGMAVTVFNLIPSFTNMFGKSVLPCIAEDHSAGNAVSLHDNVTRAFFTTAYIAVPCGAGISAIAPDILGLLFPARAAERAVCILPLRILGVGIIFLSVSSVLFQILQGMGKSSIPVRIMLLGAAVKLVGNILLTPVPVLNISGAAISTVLCCGIVFILSVYETSRCTGCTLKELAVLIAKIIFCGILCAAAAFLVSQTLSQRHSCLVSVPLSVLTGAIIYIISTHLMGVLNKTTLKMLIC